VNKSDICEWGGVTFVNVTDVCVMQKLAYLVFAQGVSIGDFLLDKVHGPSLFSIAI